MPLMPAWRINYPTCFRPRALCDEAFNPYFCGLAVHANGIVYVADALKITPQGTITTLLQTESPWSPTAVALHGQDQQTCSMTRPA